LSIESDDLTWVLLIPSNRRTYELTA